MRIDGKQMVELLRDAGYEPRSYSGRAMYGRNCVGVETERYKSAFVVCAELCREALNMLGQDEACDFIEALADVDVAEDSMGLDSIVYFKNIDWPKEEEPDDEDEEDDDTACPMAMPCLPDAPTCDSCKDAAE